MLTHIKKEYISGDITLQQAAQSLGMSSHLTLKKMCGKPFTEVLTTVPFDGFYNSRHEEANDREEYAEAYVNAYEQALGLDITLTFDSLESPKEYNFETDRIFARISLADVMALRSYVCDVALAGTIKENCTSRDGFISYYLNSLAAWDGEDIADWDHNQIGLILETILSDNYNIEVLL